MKKNSAAKALKTNLETERSLFEKYLEENRKIFNSHELFLADGLADTFKLMRAFSYIQDDLTARIDKLENDNT